MVWVPLTAFALLGTFAWEYLRHPDWFSRDPMTSLTPSSQLTPEEEAQLSEIDTLDVLLSGSRAPEGTATVTSQINLDTPSVDSQNKDADASTANSGVDLSAYPIPGADSITSSGASTLSPAQPSVFSDPSRPTTRPAVSGSSFNFGDGLANTTAPTAPRSALAEALDRREADLAAIEQSSGASAPTLFGNQRGTENGASNGVVMSEDTGVLPTATPVNPGSFIRTTPEMSPPVGTTGYQAPATSRLPAFNVVPQQPTRGPYSLPSESTSQFAVPTPPASQAVSSPVLPTPAIGSQLLVAPSGLYTQPSSVQPEQGPVINPRR